MKKVNLLCLLMLALLTNASATITQIRWGSTANPLHGTTITWSNTGSADSIRWGYTNSYANGTFAGIKRAGYVSGTSFFKYTFATLNPNATLYYQIYDSKAKVWDKTNTFTTAAPDSTENYSFTALGDCRTSLSVLTNISNLANSKHSTFSLFNGDLTLSGKSTTEYNSFFTAAANFLANNIIYHAEGNHDAYSTSIFSNLFDLPATNGTSLYYAFHYGNGIFITLNTCDPGNAAQLAWLKTTLAAAAADPKITWKVISFHHPFFNTGNHNGDMNAYRTTIWKAFDDYGVDLILNGHDHNYQRSKPINFNVSKTSPVAQYGSGPQGGRCEIISGGAGAVLYNINSNSSDAWAINNYNANYNYTYCEVQGCKMKIIVYGETGNVIDSFTLDKSASCNISNEVSNSKATFNPISVYPNPSEGPFTLAYQSAEIGEATISIFDGNGKAIATEKINKTSTDLVYHYDLSKHDKGIYIVSITIGNQKDNAILILK
jgi:predicted MPP superfamily phosphohydrolase